jgi:hypothetical protein
MMIDKSLQEAIRQELYAKQVNIMTTPSHVMVAVTCADGKTKHVTIHHSGLWGIDTRMGRFNIIVDAWQREHNILGC